MRRKKTSPLSARSFDVKVARSTSKDAGSKHNDSKHNDSKHNDSKHKVTLSREGSVIEPKTPFLNCLYTRIPKIPEIEAQLKRHSELVLRLPFRLSSEIRWRAPVCR